MHAFHALILSGPNYEVKMPNIKVKVIHNNKGINLILKGLFTDFMSGGGGSRVFSLGIQFTLNLCNRGITVTGGAFWTKAGAIGTA